MHLKFHSEKGKPVRQQQQQMLLVVFTAAAAPTAAANKLFDVRAIWQLFVEKQSACRQGGKKS